MKGAEVHKDEFLRIWNWMSNRTRQERAWESFTINQQLLKGKGRSLILS